MANCCSCTELKEHAPEFTTNGVTDSVCESLQEDTGLNASAEVLHDDFEDLNLANDCYLGNLKKEIDAYEVCDWKKYTKRLVSGAHLIIKSIICAIGGLWKEVYELQTSIKEIIKIILGSLTAISYTNEGSAITQHKLIKDGSGRAETDITIWSGKQKLQGKSVTTVTFGLGGSKGWSAANLQPGDQLCYWTKASLINYMGEKAYNQIYTYGFLGQIGVVGNIAIYGLLIGNGGNLELKVHTLVTGSSATGKIGVTSIAQKIFQD